MQIISAISSTVRSRHFMPHHTFPRYGLRPGYAFSTPANSASLSGPRPIESNLPENPHALKVGQGGRYCYRHRRLDLGLPNTVLADVEIHEQAGTTGIVLANLCGYHSGQGRRHLIGPCNPIPDRVMLQPGLAVCRSPFGPAIFIAATPARNVCFRTLNALVGAAAPCFESWPLP